MSKTLLVLGARSDIGQAVAHEFASNGFDIILAARNVENLLPVMSDLEIRFSIKTYLAEFDAEIFDSHGEFYTSLPVKPDVILCVFGYLGEQKAAQLDWNEAAKIVNVNYVGAVSILNIAAKDFETRNEGTIIGISSVAGERGRQSNYIYGSAKGGLSIYLDGMRHRFANSNVNVITVKPGFVDTKMTASMNLPKLLTAQPSDLAKAIFKAYKNGKSTLYFVRFWRPFMFIIRSIPEFIFKKTKL